MALFGKKKKEDATPESLGFGFPATEKRKMETEGVTPIAGAMPPEPVMPEPMAPEPELPPIPEQVKNVPAPAAPQMVEPAPTPGPNIPEAAVKPEIEPVLEARPSMPMMPERIEAPRAPVISKLRPHVFLKISKYKEVMASIDRIMEHIKGLKSSLKSIRNVDEKEALKLKESEGLLIKLEEVASVFDKIFSSPEK